MKKDTRNFLLFSLSIIIVNIIIWWFLAYPYRCFPSDDCAIFLPRPLLTLHPWFRLVHHPVFMSSVKVCKLIWSLFSKEVTSPLLLHAILSNSILLFILGAIIFRLTKKNTPVVIGLLLYATSAWPATYYFFSDYPVFATIFCLLTFLLIIEAYLNQYRRIKLLILSGVVSALFFLSSPSALLMISLQSLMIFCLFSSVPFLKRIRFMLFYFLPLFFIAISYVLLSRLEIVHHWFANIVNIGKYSDALNKFGYVPHPPFLSFFRIGFVYAPVIFILFIIVSIVLFLIKKRDHYLTKILLLLTLIIYIHPLLIDILPFTKLGRTHFPVYPLVIIVLVVTLNYLIPIFLNTFARWKYYLYAFCAFLFVFLIWENVTFSSEMVHAKQYSPKEFSRISSDREIYMLEKDVHADAIAGWLGICPRKINSLNQINTEKGRKVALIIGPHGRGSGKSVLRHSTLDDFLFDNTDIIKPPQAVEIKLPYYMYFPSFIFEEEISQALYFSGNSPDYKSDNMKITVWLWETN